MDQFLWSEVASDASDRGVEVVIPWQGKPIPFRIKRSLTIDERERANKAGVQIELDSQGRPTLAKQDQAAFTKEVVLIGLKYWPFEYSPGKPVPINRKTVAEIDGGLLTEIAGRILGVVEVRREDFDPFESPSDEDFSMEEQPILS